MLQLMSGLRSAFDLWCFSALLLLAFFSSCFHQECNFLFKWAIYKEVGEVRKGSIEVQRIWQHLYTGCVNRSSFWRLMSSTVLLLLICAFFQQIFFLLIYHFVCLWRHSFLPLMDNFRCFFYWSDEKWWKYEDILCWNSRHSNWSWHILYVSFWLHWWRVIQNDITDNILILVFNELNRQLCWHAE